MKIWILSDLHMEQCRWVVPTNLSADVRAAEVVVLAGDIHTPLTRSLTWLAEQRDAGHFAAKAIVMVAGNHEFYHADIDAQRAEAARLSHELGIHYLDCRVAVIGVVRFVGCTLWTDYELYGNVVTAMSVADRALNDHRLIERGGRRFTPSEALVDHQVERAWLEATLSTPFAGPTVVITHHGVSQRSVHARWAGDELTSAFSSNLDDLVERSGAALWVHGHTHDSFDYMLGRTRVMCNPKGYGPSRTNPRVENPAFDASLVVELMPATQPV